MKGDHMEQRLAKGFLLIDQKGNSILISANEEWLHEFLRYKGTDNRTLDRIRVHQTQKALFDDIRAYLKGWYE